MSDRRDEATYRALFEGNPTPTLLVEPETTRIVDANTAALALYGFTREELFARTLAELRPEEDRERFRLAYAESASRGGDAPSIVPGSWRHLRKDGSILHVEIWRVRMTLEGERRLAVLVNDVSARFATEARLRDAESKWRSLVAYSSDYIFTTDAHDRIDALNRALPGTRLEDFVGHSIYDFVAPEGAARLRAVVSRARETRQAQREEGVGLMPDGSRRWYATHWIPRELPDGSLGLINVSTDITASKLAEEALRESDERYRQLFDATPLPAFVLDEETLQYLAVNDAAVELYGYSHEEFSKLSARDVRPAEDVPAFERAVRADIGRAMSRESRGVWRHKKKDGTIMSVELTTSSIRFAGRRARLAVVQDVTERQVLEEQLRQSQKMEAIGLLAGGVAHDFNNLLNVILGSIELARRANATGAAFTEHLDAVALAGAHAAELTRKLLALSRKQLLRVETIDLRKTVSDLAKVLLGRALGEDVELDVALGDEPLWVRADTSQLAQTLLNLSTNARQAMPAGGRISIAARRVDIDEAYARAHRWARPGRFAELEVRDTGCGMDDATRARVFEPFFTTKEGGSGLGLAVVYGIVEQHSGCVGVESALGGGTTVRVLLPLMDAPATARPSAPPPTDARGGHEAVLVAEDQAVLRSLVAQSLADLGYDVVEAADGEEAVAKFRARRDVRLVILDVVMPRIGGREAFARIKELDPSARALFVTGYAPDSAHVADLAGREDVAVLDKPFRLEDLARQVRRLLDGRRAGAQGSR